MPWLSLGFGLWSGGDWGGLFFPFSPGSAYDLRMTKWKVQVSFRIPPDLHCELDEAALRQRIIYSGRRESGLGFGLEGS